MESEGWHQAVSRVGLIIRRPSIKWCTGCMDHVSWVPGTGAYSTGHRSCSPAQKGTRHMFPKRQHPLQQSDLEDWSEVGASLGLVIMPKAIILAVRGLQEVDLPSASQAKSLRYSFLPVYPWPLSYAMDFAIKFYLPTS